MMVMNGHTAGNEQQPCLTFAMGSKLLKQPSPVVSNGSGCKFIYINIMMLCNVALSTCAYLDVTCLDLNPK